MSEEPFIIHLKLFTELNLATPIYADIIRAVTELSDLSEYLEEDGSLNLKVTAQFYVNGDEIAVIRPLQE